MRKHVRAAAFAVPILFSSASFALTLNEALQQALAHNPDLAIARLELQASEAGAVQAGERPAPELGVLVEDTARSATRTTTVQWSQPIELGGKRAARLAVAARLQEQAAVALQAKQAELRANVASAFFELLGAQAQVRLGDSTLELARKASSVTSQRLQAGKVAPLEQTKALMAEATVRAELAQARSELQIAKRRLAALWGASPLAFEQAEGDADAVPPLPTAQRVALLLADAPALRQARLDIDRRQALTVSERSKRRPDMTVTVGAKRDAELGRTQAVIGLTMPLPWLVNSNEGNLLEALRREDQAREALAAITVRVQAEVADGLDRLRLAREQVLLLRTELLPAAQLAFDTALRGYELGKFAFLDVLDAQRSLNQTRQQTLRQLADAHRAAAELDRLLGAAASAQE